jgi:hypothetical protein
MESQRSECPCAACNRPFKTRSQCPRQAYCPRTECQRERRRRWQRAKRLTDPDYKYNQRNAQRAWARRNPNYWVQYRKSHPQYCKRNRQQQLVRNGSRNGHALLNLTSSHFAGALPAGTYRIVRLRADSGPCRPLIPEHAGPAFRAMPGHHSGACRHRV